MMLNSSILVLLIFGVVFVLKSTSSFQLSNYVRVQTQNHFTTLCHSQSSCGRGQPPILCRSLVVLWLAAASEESNTKGNEENGKEGPDLLDYFDPRLSPHEYPDGIDAGRRDTSNNNPGFLKSPSSIPSLQEYKPQSVQDGIRNEKSQNQLETRNGHDKDEEELDLFDYFDPLLSPHSYPNGIKPPSSSNKSSKTSSSSYNDGDDTRYNPLRLKSVAEQALAIANDKNIPSSSRRHQRHVGILLMDHGSRNEASNQRLKNLANLYQLTLSMEQNNNDNNNNPDAKVDVSSTKTTVYAAHMEIASPSIPEGLTYLLNEGVDEIVCHPFFLSRQGRHVSEDIPAIIETAIETDKISIPIHITEPIGSNTQLMMGAIHSMVSPYFDSSSDNNG